MRVRTHGRVQLPAILCLIGVLAVVSNASASPPRKEPRRITLTSVSYSGGTTVAAGTLSAKHGFKDCTNNAPIDIYRKNPDATRSKVGSGNSDNHAVFSIEIPNESGMYVAVARALTVNLGSGDDILKCKMARSQPVNYAADGEVED